MSTGWLIGFVIGGVVVVLVVSLLLILIASARKIGTQAQEIETALESTSVRTLALWDVQHVNTRIESITQRLAAARRALGG
ncbi:MAG: hypothetical protein IH941_04790 [Acidobacteria bacterium]|nr:hypothetical protein [Acidobacteriota bacterium]